MQAHAISGVVCRLFSIVLGWLPPGGLRTIGAAPSALDRARHLIMPPFVLEMLSMALLARYTRSSVMSVLREDYVRTARTKGLAERAVIGRHALRNALLTFERDYPMIMGSRS